MKKYVLLWLVPLVLAGCGGTATDGADDEMAMDTVAEEQPVLADTVRQVFVNLSDHLLSESKVYPVAMHKGDTLFLDAELPEGGNIKIYNADSRRQLASYASSKKHPSLTVHDTIRVPNRAIYLLELNPRTEQYVECFARHTIDNLDRYEHPEKVVTEEIAAKPKDFMAHRVDGVKMKNLFEEPRKFTLRGQLKAAFSGSSRAIVALQVPVGASDVLYSLRISTNEGDSYQDGQFYDNMCTSYKKVKFLGLPLYESQGGSGLLATLLGENKPVREEDAYIDMFVFYDAAQARKFQNGAETNKLKYNIDYSTMGTQSCNGRIPARKGCKTIYLGFLNERMRYNNYVWLEAISAVPETEYFKQKYSIK